MMNLLNGLNLPSELRYLCVGSVRMVMLACKVLVSLLLVVLLLVCLLLGTSAGREKLLEEGLYGAFAMTPFSIHLEGVESDTLAHWQIGLISVSYQDNRLVQLNEATLVLTWQTIFDHALTFESLDVGRVWVNVDPAFWPDKNVPKLQNKQEDIAPSGTMAHWMKGWRLAMGSLAVNELTLQHPVLPTNVFANLSLQGLELSQLETKAPDINLDYFDFNLDKKKQWLRGGFHNHKLEGQMRLNHFPLAVLSIFLDDLNSGWLSADLEIAGSLLSPHVKGKISTSTKLLGLPLEAKAHLDYAKMVVDFSNLDGHWDSLSLNGRGNIKLGSDLASNSLLDILVTQASMPLDFARNFGAQLPPSLSLDVHASNVRIQGPISDIRYKGKASAQGSYEQLPLSLQTQVTGSLTGLALDALSMQSGAARIDAGGTIKFAGPLKFAGHFKGINEQLLSKLAPELAVAKMPEVAFVTKGDFDVTGTLTVPVYTADLSLVGAVKQKKLSMHSRLSGSLEQLEIQKLELRLQPKTNQAVLTASGVIDVSKSSLKLKVAADNIPIDLFALVGVSIPKDLTGQLFLNADVSGPWYAPFITVKSEVSGFDKKEPYQLVLDGRMSKEALEISKSSLTHGGKTIITLDGRIDALNQNVSAVVNDFDLAKLSRFGWKQGAGKLQANLRYRGDQSNSYLKGQLSYSTDLESLNQEVQPQRSPVHVNAIFDTADEIAVVDSKIFFENQQTSQLQLKLPLAPYRRWLAQWLDASMGECIAPCLEKQKDKSVVVPIQFQLDGSLDLNALQNLMHNDLESFGGLTALSIRATGTNNAPEIIGEFNLREGYYKNEVTGTDLTGIELLTQLHGESIHIKRAEVSTPDKGNVTISGDASWAGEKEVAIKLVAKNAVLFERPEIQTALSGEMTLDGNQQAYQLAGRLNLEPLMLKINSSFGGVPELQVQVIDAGSQTKTMTQRAATKSIQYPLTLDLEVVAEHQAFMQGRGLMTGLEGAMKIFGPISALNYSGKLQTVRGHMKLFNKRFELVKGAAVLDGANVILNIQAENVGPDITFKIAVSGTLNDFKIVLSSDPVLPRDEVSSRLLFGTSVKNISPIQALRLVSALQTLQGGNSVLPDPIEYARKVISVDELNIKSVDTAKGSGVKVGVGKYLSDKAYIEMERTPDPNKPWQGRLDIELTPTLHLETTTSGSAGDNGVGLSWKKDY